MRSVALSFIALAATGALAQSDVPSAAFEVSAYVPSVMAHPNFIPENCR